MAKIYHPDKQSDSSPEEKEKAEREFFKIAQAYEVGGIIYINFSVCVFLCVLSV